GIADAREVDGKRRVLARVHRRPARGRLAVEHEALALRSGARGHDDLPAPAVDGAPCDQPWLRVRAGRIHGHHPPVPDRRYWLPAGDLMHQARGRQRDADGGRQADGDADPAPGPDRPPPAQDRYNGSGARRDRVQHAVEPQPQLALVIDGHGSFPSARSELSLSLARAREAWLLTLPTEHPRVAATSVSVMSIQYRSTTTARCPCGRLMSAAISTDRSSCWRVASTGCGGMSSGRSIDCSLTRRLRNRLLFALTMIRRTYASGSPARRTRGQEAKAFASAVCARSSASPRSPVSP